MASKITRVTQLLFGSNAGSQEIAEFGSKASGTPTLIGPGNPAEIQSLPAYLSGWFAAVILGNSPCIEDMNAIDYLYSYQLGYILQQGMPEWDAGTSYFTNSMASSGGLIYVSLQDNNLNNAVSDGSFWVQLAAEPEFTNQSANVVFAGPSSGSAAQPAFRGLVSADLPTVPLTKGGTGQTTKAPAFDALQPMSTAGDIIYGGASGTGTRLPAGTTGQALTMASGTTPGWTTLLPAGMVTMFGGSAAPTGWLLCDGSAISRTTFAALFSAISTTYGVGNGTTTFNIPNTQGAFVRGTGSQTIGGISYTGTQGTAQGDQMQGHVHNPLAGSGFLEVSTGILAPTTGSSTTIAATTGTPASDGTNGTPRTGTETRPANIVLTYIIKT